LAETDPRLGFAGYTEGRYQKGEVGENTYHRQRLDRAPKKLLYSQNKNSIGPGRPTRVVVTGFSVLTAESKIRSLLSSYGDLADCMNHIDPMTGAPLGIFSARFQDRLSTRQNQVVLKAGEAAARAEKEGNGTRIDQAAVKIQLDREGIKCKKYIEGRLNSKRKHQAKLQEEEARKRPTPQAVPTGPALAPSNAPKGPSRRAMAPPAGPSVRHASVSHVPSPVVAVPNVTAAPAATAATAANSHSTHSAHSLVEMESLLPRMKKTPYLFLAHCYVPVLGTTIAHLKKRLRSYDWIEVKCDRTGYFVTFENSRKGKNECKRTHEECHMYPLFTYTMNFECHENGNPHYVRSPSPERIAAVSRQKEQKQRIRRDDELDFEAEKRERAENLDPVRAALDLLMPELKDTILKEVRAKIAFPHILDCLHPDKHKEKRAALGLPDPREADSAKPVLPLAGQLSTFGAQQSRQKLLNKKPFGKFTKQRPDRREDLRQPVNVYDERRKRPVQSRARPIVPLHRRLQDFREEDDSDDERHTTITRDSEGPESHPVSEIGTPARLELDEGLQTPKSKRRRVEAWGAESDDERQEQFARKALGHLMDKEPEDMAMGELQQVLSTFPRSSEIRQRAAAEIKLRHKAKQDDKLFGILPEAELDSTPVPTIEDVEMLDVPSAKPKKKVGVAKPKKKTKKEILAEQEVLKAEAKAEEEAIKTLEEEEAVTPAVEEEEEPRAEVEWAVSEEAPRKTVEDDPNLLLDIDGWQNILKDDEDMKFLLEALNGSKLANIVDPRLWAWKQKEFKALNASGAKTTPCIEGYYVPNPTGSARTEGYKKISQPEKSKYLPHRIRVQKAREERERQAKDDPQKAIEAAKAVAAAKIASTASSRTNRANNRRLVNEITISKAAIGADTDALKFNQLKKRKKLVRFDRSAIHNWGLYAEENIAASDMIIEYVGEKVRQRVADLREINYQKQGIGSSYLFRIDEDTVVDATKKGGIARFINHSCMPNCTAKIIKVDGTKRIVIYALRDIAKSESGPISHENFLFLTSPQTRNSRTTTSSSARSIATIGYRVSAVQSAARASLTSLPSGTTTNNASTSAVLRSP
jgi:histone-lysine N-methyltransferase SETD1